MCWFSFRKRKGQNLKNDTIQDAIEGGDQDETSL